MNEGRDFEASTSLFEPTVTGEYYIVKNSAEGSYRFTKGYDIFANFIAKMDLYVYAGVGPAFYKVKPNDNLDQWKIVNGDDKYGGVAAVFPVGLGANYLISPNVLLGIDIGIRYTTSDFLDGYSSQYSKSNDVYYFMTFVFTHKLKHTEKGLPSFRK